MQLAFAGLVSMTGHLEKSGQAIRLRGKSIRIEADPPVPTELDGEVIGTTPLDVEVVPSAIELIRG